MVWIPSKTPRNLISITAVLKGGAWAGMWLGGRSTCRAHSKLCLSFPSTTHKKEAGDGNFLWMDYWRYLRSQLDLVEWVPDKRISFRPVFSPCLALHCVRGQHAGSTTDGSAIEPPSLQNSEQNKSLFSTNYPLSGVPL
jgi:hypothetical protein